MEISSMSQNLRFLSGRHGVSSLMEDMTAAGALSDAAIRELAQKRGFPAAALYGAASFYDFLRDGKKAHVCTGTVCRMSGKEAGVRQQLAARFTPAEIGEMACVGHCYRAGGYEVGGRTFDAHDLTEDIPFRSTLADPVFGAVEDCEALYGAALQDAPDTLAQLTASGLRGRGGAGFPFARKLQSCAAQSGEKYVVCNADEGDPGAFSDRFLLEQRPERVLAGMLAAAQVLGARTGFIYLRAEYPDAAAVLEAAIERFDRSATGTASGFSFRIVRGAGSYVCGEETALLNSIEGLRPEVRVRPPFPAENGLFGQPTLLSNVETFAAIPWILARGGAAFAAIGNRRNGRSTGSKLMSLDRLFVRPGVLEVAMGTPLAEVVYELGGGFTEPVKALQVGGPLGGVLPIDYVNRLSVDFESFQDAGFLLGHASLVAIPQTFPMGEFLTHLFEFMADESCGRCFPCRLGTRKGADLLAGAPQQPIDRSLFDELLETLEQGSLCALGGGLPLPARNILTHFPDEMAAYFVSGDA
jgi:NADH-quinone oxidoreductase subunit F